MAQQLRFLLDGEDRGQPLNPEDFGLTIAEDDSINARIVSFNNDLTFGGATYRYLFDKVVDSSFCRLINVEVDYKCDGVWNKLLDGYIVVTETVFDMDRCQAKTRLYDETFSTKINNNKGIPFSLSCTVTKNLEPIVPPARRLLKMFNPAIPTSVFESGRGVSIYDAFTHLIGCMSDNLIDFESDLFFSIPSTVDTVCITNGRSLRTNQDIETVVTFEQLYRDLKAKYNLGMGFFKQPSGRPVLRIEPIEYFFSVSPSASLLDQPNVDLRFDTQKIYAAVQFGNSVVLEANESSSPNDPPQSLTFIQTPFRGFRQERFGFSGECNTSNVLNVEANEIIFDTNAIEDVIRFNNDTFDLDNFIIQVDYYAGVAPYFLSRAYDPYNIGQSVFNGGFTNSKVSERWLNGYPSSLFSFLEEPFDPATTEFEVRMDATPAQQFDIDDDALTYYSEWSGDFIVFGTSIIPNSNFVTGRSYIAPFTGLYTFTISVCLDDFFLTGNRVLFAALRIFNTSDVQIELINGTPILVPNIDVAVVTLTAQVVLNQGDQVRGDVAGQFDSAGPPQNQIILNTLNIGGTDFYTSFEGIGTPLTPEELEAVDTQDLRTFLYEFERPLSMSEITSIINQTSSPIELGRTTDSNAAIDGYIKTMEVQSVTRQNAKFVLKSNEILR